MDESVLFAKWLAGVCVGFFDKHERAIEDGRTGSDDSCFQEFVNICLLYTSPSPRDKRQSRMPSSA